MVHRLTHRHPENERGITGLETAIVLIAFVMVASVFAYVVLSAGLFSSQKAKEAVHAGLTETRSSVILKGNVIARMVDGTATEIYFGVSTVPGGDAVDFTNAEDTKYVVISYSDSRQFDPDVSWSVTKLTSRTDDDLLDEGDLFQITVDLSASKLTQLPGPYERFVLEVKPPRGAALAIERTIPGRMDQLVNLH